MNYGDNVGSVGSVVIVDIQDPDPGPYIPVRTEGYQLVPRLVGCYPSPPVIPSGYRRDIHCPRNNARRSDMRRARMMMTAGGLRAAGRDHPTSASVGYGGKTVTGNHIGRAVVRCRDI